MLGARDDMFILGPRIMNARAATPSQQIKSPAANSAISAGRHFIRRIASNWIMGSGIPAKVYGVATARPTIFSFCNLPNRPENSSFDIAALANRRRNMPPLAPSIIAA
jgi:hypothetical protein